MKFNQWLNSELSRKPSPTLDQKVLQRSRELMIEEKNYLNIALSSLAFCMFAVLLIKTSQLNLNQTDLPNMAKSKDMILNYKDMELMADAGDLTERDWEIINRE